MFDIDVATFFSTVRMYELIVVDRSSFATCLNLPLDTHKNLSSAVAEMAAAVLHTSPIVKRWR